MSYDRQGGLLTALAKINRPVLTLIANK